MKSPFRYKWNKLKNNSNITWISQDYNVRQKNCGLAAAKGLMVFSFHRETLENKMLR